jgi:hypothetical protein
VRFVGERVKFDLNSSHQQDVCVACSLKGFGKENMLSSHKHRELFEKHNEVMNILRMKQTALMNGLSV